MTAPDRHSSPACPEPLAEPSEWTDRRPGGVIVDPTDRVTLDESIHMAFLVVLESVTPAERVAFVLHDVFGYPFAEVAEIVNRTPAGCRQLASSARRRIRASQAPATPSARRAAIVSDFKQAWEAQDIDAIVRLLDPNVVTIADGGGLASATLRPIEGGRHVAQVSSRSPTGCADLTLHEHRVNVQPGLVGQQQNVTVTVVAFDMARDRITHIWVRAPDKLRPWAH